MQLHKLPDFTRRPFFAIGILTLCLLLTVLVSTSLLRDARQEADDQIRLRSGQIVVKVEERLQAYALVLRSMAGLFQINEQVSREQWRRHTELMRVNDALINVQGMGFSQLIQPQDLVDHEESVRAEGFPDYQVTPPGLRDIYSAIVYLEPFDFRNQQAFGFDMFSEPVRRVAMSQARDTGRAALTGKVELLQETGVDVQAGTLMYVPVYQPGMPVSTIDQRREALIGWAYSPYRMADLMTGVLGEQSQGETANIAVLIYDEIVSESSLLFSNHPESSLPLDTVTESVIEFNGKRWLLAFTWIPGQRGVNYATAVAAGVVGGLISILLYLLIASLSRTRHEAMRLAEQLTAEIRKSQEELEASEQRWRFALDGPGDGVWDWDLHTNHVFYSPGWRKMLGLQDKPINNALQDWESRIHPDDQPMATAVLQDYLHGRATSYHSEYRLLCENGDYKWVLDRGAVVGRDADNRPVRLIGSISDITARKEMELALRKANAEAEHFRQALDFVDSYIYIKDVQRRYLYGNRATLQLFNRDEKTLPGSTDREFFPKASCQHIARIDKIVLAGEKTRDEVEVIREDGSRIVYLEVKSPIYDDDQSQVIGILGISTDITPMKDHEAKMEHIAHYDSLTGLPNRLLLADRLHQAMATARRQKHKLAVVYLDLDGFKTINDTHGHEAGDQVLRMFADRLMNSVREGDTAARLGGDEFVVMLAGFNDIRDIKPVLRRLLNSAGKPFDVDGARCRISASMGISVFPQSADTAEDQLLRQADQAMYKAKNSGKNCAYLYAENGDIQQLELGDDHSD
jgi:diguanylate cyclase (GGDEF)-like protein/PAS domain S-box-containing protein